jgi:hypothetical protein
MINDVKDEHNDNAVKHKGCIAQLYISNCDQIITLYLTIAM